LLRGILKAAISTIRRHETLTNDRSTIIVVMIKTMFAMSQQRLASKGGKVATGHTARVENGVIGTKETTA
jgi:hypothetical protein